MITRVLLTTLALTATAHAQGFSVGGQRTAARFGAGLSLITDTTAAWTALSGAIPGLSNATTSVAVQPLDARTGDPMCQVPDALSSVRYGTYALTEFGVVERRANTCHLILPTAGLRNVTLGGVSGLLRVTAVSDGQVITWYFHPGTRVLALTAAEAQLPPVTSVNVSPTAAPTANATRPPAPPDGQAAPAAAPAVTAPPTVLTIPTSRPLPAARPAPPPSLLYVQRAPGVNVAARLDGKLTVLPSPTGDAAAPFSALIRDATGRTCRLESLELSFREWNGTLAQYAEAVTRVFGESGSAFTVLTSTGEDPTAERHPTWHVTLLERNVPGTVYLGLMNLTDAAGAQQLTLYACRLN